VKVTFERDVEGKIREVIDPSGERIKYDYDGKQLGGRINIL